MFLRMKNSHDKKSRFEQSECLKPLVPLLAELAKQVDTLEAATKKTTQVVQQDQMIAFLKHGILSALLKDIDAAIVVFNDVRDNADEKVHAQHLVKTLLTLLDTLPEKSSQQLALTRGVSKKEAQVLGITGVSFFAPFAVAQMLGMLVTLPMVGGGLLLGAGLTELSAYLFGVNETKTQSAAILSRLHNTLSEIDKTLSSENVSTPTC